MSDAFPVRTFVLRSDEEVQRFMLFMKTHRRPMAKQERYLQVVVSEYKPKRTSEQNAYMWAAIIEPIAQQVKVQGERFAPEVWNEHLKEMFLPEKNARGMDKWLYLPNGQRRLAMSTTDLQRDEFAVYLDSIAHYAHHDLGVQLPAHPSERL